MTALRSGATSRPGTDPTETGGDRLVRSAAREDLQALVALEADCFPEPWAAAALRWGLGEPLATLLVICPRWAPDEVLGYLFMRRHGDEAEVLRIAVAPESRCSGLATALLDAGLVWLGERGVRRCLLEVRANNRAALALYRRFGFSVVGRRVGYYRDGSDAVVCALHLATRPPWPP